MAIVNDFDDAINNEIFEEMDDETSEEPIEAARKVILTHTATDKQVGVRIDKLAGEVFGDFSRAVLQKYIQTGELLVNGFRVKPKYAVKMGDVLVLDTKLVPHSVDMPEDIDLDKVYEDDELLIINKPAGLVVHPGAGNQTGTLVNGLLYHYPDQAHLPRAGLVHRIDKDTTGLLLVAKTAQSQLDLICQLKEKTVYRNYQCVVIGTVKEIVRHRTIDAPIARHPKERTKMAVRQGGKPAITHINKIQPISDNYCLLDVALQTGRTHQIRVHLSSVGHPLVGDKVYAAPPKKGLGKQEYQIASAFGRQALHAHTLGFVHPTTKKQITVSCPLPEDMQQLILDLQNSQ